MLPLMIVIGIHLFVLVFLFLVADLAKSRLFAEDSAKVLKTLFKSIGIAFRHFFSSYFLGFLLLVVPVLLFGGSFLLRSAVSVGTAAAILLLFIVQQAIIFCRVFLRVWRLSSVYDFHLKI
jgi:hypothetical protein